MQSDTKIAVIGGDMRQLVMAEALAKSGFETAVYGFDNSPVALKEVTRCSTLDCAICQANMVILPLPYSHDKIHINTPLSKSEIHISDIFDNTHKLSNKFIIGGLFDDTIKKIAAENEVSLCDYYLREELTILNALTTAEGAISIALQELPVIIDASKTIVLGYGRIGKLLASKLKALGAEVTVAARKTEDFSWIRANGFHAVQYSELPDILSHMDVIFNTVPVMVLDQDKLKLIRHDCIVIDLASMPGGLDHESARQLGLKVIWALSLPGKYAPVTSGLILKDTIQNICREEGLLK